MKTFITACFLVAAWALPSQPPPSLAKRQATDCPLYLPTNNFEYPHLIVPISASSPNAAIGNSYTPSISPNDFASIFNFDIPPSRAGQTCTLYFSLPRQSQLSTSSFSFSGSGTFDFVEYQPNTGAVSGTTWSTQPPLNGAPVTTLSHVTPGNSYKVWSGSCGAGELLSWRMSSVDSCLWYFEDYNDCAIGAYIVYG